MPRPSPVPASKRLRAGCRLARSCATTWRETGAKAGDFPLQTTTIGARSERVDTEKSITYPLAPALTKVGSGMGSWFRFHPRRSRTTQGGAFGAEQKVRIHLPPVKSLQTFGP